MSSFSQPYYALDNSALSFRRRNPRFSWEELQILAQETAKNFEVLRQKETDDSVKQLKQRIWAVIAEKVNAVNRSTSRREPLQLKRKWIEARSRVRHKLLASQRRRQELSGATAGAAAVADAASGDRGAHAGAVAENGTSSNPVELSYFEKLLTLNMSEELHEEEARERRSAPAAASARHLRYPRHRRPPVHLGVKKDHFDSEEEDEEEAPSCVTMTPDDLSQEGSANPDVEMWTGSSAGGEEDLDLSTGPGGEAAAFRNGGLQQGGRLGPPMGSQDLRVPPTPPPAALTNCLNCGGGLAVAQTLERMLSERHALKLNILHNKAHYWYAKCRELAPESAIPPPSPGGVARPSLERAAMRSALSVKSEFFDPPMASS